MTRIILKYLKRFFYTLGIIIGLLVVYVLLIFGLSKVETSPSVKSADTTYYTIYILSNGVHTDIVVPTSSSLIDWSEHVPYENSYSKKAGLGLLAFGWGDKGFYLSTPTWADLTFNTAFKAASGLSTSAMHCTYYDKLKASETCIPLTINESQYQNLINYIFDSFQLSEAKNTIHIPNNYYGTNDAFYEGNGTYSIFYTCNTWANQALKAADQKACLWTLFDFSILNLYTQD